MVSASQVRILSVTLFIFGSNFFSLFLPDSKITNGMLRGRVKDFIACFLHAVSVIRRRLPAKIRWRQKSQITKMTKQCELRKLYSLSSSLFNEYLVGHFRALLWTPYRLSMQSEMQDSRNSRN